MSIDLSIDLPASPNLKPFTPRRKATKHKKPATGTGGATLSTGDPSTENLPAFRFLTIDPFTTIGLDLHVQRIRCVRCGSVHLAPCARQNATTRRTKKAFQTKHERLVGSPPPWLSTSTATATDLIDWLENPREAKKWLDDDRAVNVTYHDDWATACHHCISITPIDSANDPNPQLSLFGEPSAERSTNPLEKTND